MLDDMFDYVKEIRDRPVWQPIPDNLRASVQYELPRKPSDLADVHRTFMQDILPYSVGNVHPGFMGWVHGGGTPVGMLAEMLSAGLNANLGGRDQMPIEIERQVVAWVRELFHFPSEASGVFVTGTSMANFMGVLVARTGASGPQVGRTGIAAEGQRLVGYTSEDAHVSVLRAFDMSGIGADALRRVPVNARHEMDTDILARLIERDRASGNRPFLVVGTAGSVDTGAIDDLGAIADISSTEKLWFHVDGAYGALGMLSPKIAPRLVGIERADSLAFDFHKWGQVPYDAGFLLVRDGALHRSTFATSAAYLVRQDVGMAAGSPWPCDLGPDLSRSFRALKTWFTIKVYGADSIGAVISRTCELAQYMEERIELSRDLELLAPVSLNVVCFGYRCEDPNRTNVEITAAIQESGIAAPSTTTVAGRTAIRAAIVNHRTTRADIDGLLDAVVSFGNVHAVRRRKSS